MPFAPRFNLLLGSNSRGRDGDDHGAIGKVRRAYWVQGKKIRAIARDTVRRIVRGGETERVYERREQPLPKLGAFREKLDAALDDNEKKPRHQRLTAKRIYEVLPAAGYVGGYDAVRRYAQR